MDNNDSLRHQKSEERPYPPAPEFVHHKLADARRDRGPGKGRKQQQVSQQPSLSPNCFPERKHDRQQAENLNACKVGVKKEEAGFVEIEAVGDICFRNGWHVWRKDEPRYTLND